MRFFRLHSVTKVFGLPLMVLAGSAVGEMQALEDDFLSGVSGQSGITLNLEANTRVAEIAYFDDDSGIPFQGFRLRGAAGPDDTFKPRILVDNLEDGR